MNFKSGDRQTDRHTHTDKQTYFISPCWTALSQLKRNEWNSMRIKLDLSCCTSFLNLKCMALLWCSYTRWLRRGDVYNHCNRWPAAVHIPHLLHHCLAHRVELNVCLNSQLLIHFLHNIVFSALTIVTLTYLQFWTIKVNYPDQPGNYIVL